TKRTVWISELWSKGHVDTHIGVDEIKAFREAIEKTDPSLYKWMVMESLELWRVHRNYIKKNWK
ncbi:unnamed protein product, partial [marine sediment metagenome]